MFGAFKVFQIKDSNFSVEENYSLDQFAEMAAMRNMAETTPRVMKVILRKMSF
jgi:hypothetical protein